MPQHYKKKLENQINLLAEQLKKARTKEQVFKIYTALTSMLSFYEINFSNKHKISTQIDTLNPYYNQLILAKKKAISEEGINNFIENKNFHRDFLGEIICNLEKQLRVLDFEKTKAKSTIYSRKELETLLKDYLDKEYKKGASIYKELLKDKRILVNPNLKNSDVSGLTVHDCYNGLSFVSTDSLDGTIAYLTTIIHEIGHVEEFSELAETREVYYHPFSPYKEVNALYREKEFYQFLSKRKHKEEVQQLHNANLKLMFYTASTILVFSNLPDYIFKCVDYDRDKDINYALIYYYGELLSFYFLEYQDEYSWFKNSAKRVNLFDKELFKELNITSSKVTKVLEKTIKKQ